jgi:3D-(3,5/4)-trihydroxycyclohexane-1,2-dione acylhydrolase (decyclizing)
VLIDNGGFASIGGLSASLGQEGFGTRYRFRAPDGQLSGARIPVDFEQNARSLGVRTVRARTIGELRAALADARQAKDSTVIVIETDREARVPGHESWWDVPPAEVSMMKPVQAARRAYEEAVKKERWPI